MHACVATHRCVASDRALASIVAQSRRDAQPMTSGCPSGLVFDVAPFGDYTGAVKIGKAFQNGSRAPVSDVASKLLQALVQAGYSYTRPRQVLAEVLASAQGCLSPAEIGALARERHEGVGAVTVYRTLQIMVALGLVRRVHLEDGCHSYALAGRTHGHHLICSRCLQTVEFEDCNLDVLLERVSRETGYCVQQHWLELLGLCPACQSATVTAGGGGTA